MECARVRQRLDQAEKQAEEATKSLAEERQQTQVRAETAANQLELMRKVSNYNVLSDSNKLLRDERDQLLNSKQELEAKIGKLETDIEPLQGKIREIESERDTLSVERDALQDEVNRWKNRANNVIEQHRMTDPEEYKRLLQEKENMRRQLAQAKEDSFKYQNEAARVTKQCTSQQTALNNLKQEAVKAGQELSIVKKQLEEKTNDSEQKQTTINRLKQIGRKYKEQADKTNKELEDLKAKAAGQETEKANVTSLELSITELRRTNTTNSARISTLEAQLTEAQNEAQAATKRAEQTLAEISELKEAKDKKEESITELRRTNSARISTLEAQLTEAQNEAQAATKRAEQTVAENSELRETRDRMQEELNQSQSLVTQLQAQVDDLNRRTAEFDRKTAEFDKKAAQSRQVMQSARTKIIEQQNRMRQLEAENAELRVRVETSGGAGGSVSGEAGSQEEAGITMPDLQAQLDQLRTENAEYQAQLEQLRTENAEYLAKVHQLQRQLEHKHSPSQQGSGASSSDAPKTANIKPMALASSSSRQTAPSITSHPAHSSHSPAAVKATASIRPMAISPTTCSLPVSVDTLPGPSGLQQSSLPAASVSGRIQIVEPQVMERNTDISSEQTEEVAMINQAVVPPSVQQEVQAASPITQVVNPVTPTPSSSSSVSSAGAVIAAAAVETMPSQQQQQQQQHQQHTTGVALGKRSRDDDSFTSEETESKRTRISTQ
ncbi:nucleoprotein TPR, partial [Elysia marginata]